MVKLEIELTSEQLQEIKATYNLTEKSKPKLVYKGRLKPNMGDKYWSISSLGKVFSEVWGNDNVDNLRYALGNVYYSEEEAEFALQKQLVTQELKDFALAHNYGKIDWENDDAKHYICLSCFSTIRDLLVYNTLRYQFSNAIYFTSARIAQQAIDEIGKDRLIKYYFGEWEQINERH